MEYEYTLTFTTDSQAVAKAFVNTTRDLWGDYYDEVLEAYARKRKPRSFSGVLDLDYCSDYSDSILELMKTIAQEIYDDSFSADFVTLNCSCDGDNIHSTYKYEKGKMIVSYVNTVSSSLKAWDCSCYDEDKGACYDKANDVWIDEDDLDEIASIEQHTFGKKYKCPVCGSQITFQEEGYAKKTIKIERKIGCDGFIFENCKGGVKLTGCDVKDKVITIPCEVNGKKVISLCTGCFKRVRDKTITIPSSVAVIEKATFGNLNNVDIYFPDTLTELTEDIVIWGSRIRVHIPSTVTEIHEYAFGDALPIIFGSKGSVAEAFAKRRDMKFEEE